MSPDDEAFLSNLNPRKVKRADRARVLELMASAVWADGDEATASRLLADAETVKAGKPLRRRTMPR